MSDNLTMRWKAVDRKRAEFIVWARQKFRVALRRQLIQFQRATEDAVVVGDLSRGVNFISDQPIRDAFEQVYAKVAGSFAVETNQRLKSTKGYLVKDFTVSDYRDAILAWVGEYAGERIVGITQTSQSLMQRIIQRAFDEGLGIDEAKRLINKQFPQYSIARSEVIARTEIVSASNLGSITAARATGLTLNKVWLSTRDNRTRTLENSDFDHASVDRQKVGINEMFNVSGENLEYPGDVAGSPGNVINCFTGDNKVSFTSLKKIIRSRFTGKVYTVHLSDKSSFTATGNHPILCDTGFVRVDEIKQGMNLACDILKGKVPVNFDVDGAKVTLKELYDSFSVHPMIVRISAVNVNLYGRIIDSGNIDIDVIDVERLLGSASPSKLNKRPHNINLHISNFAKRLFFSNGLLDGGWYKKLSRLCLDRFVSALNLIGFFLIAHLRPLQQLGLTSSSNGNTVLNQPCSNDVSRASKIISDRLFTHAGSVHGNGGLAVNDSSFGIVSFNSVTHVDVKQVVNEYVYTLETDIGIYNVNSVIASNCRCTIFFEE